MLRGGPSPTGRRARLQAPTPDYAARVTFCVGHGNGLYGHDPGHLLDDERRRGVVNPSVATCARTKRRGAIHFAYVFELRRRLRRRQGFFHHGSIGDHALPKDSS